MEKKVFIVENPNRRKETDQYNVRVLQLDEILILMQLAKKEVFRDFDKHFKEWEDLNFNNYEEIKQRHLSNSEPKGGTCNYNSKPIPKQQALVSIKTQKPKWEKEKSEENL